MSTPVSTTEDLLIDLSSRAKLRLTGADRVRFLNGQVSNDMRRVGSRETVYTCVMTIKGKMCADAFVHAGEDFLFVDTEPDLRETLAARLERYIIADDVQLEDVSDEFHLLHLLPAEGGTNELPGLGELRGDPVDARKLQVVQSTRYGKPGIDLFLPATLADEYRTLLAKNFRILTPEETEALRITAGVPRWGAELGEDTMPAEAGLETRAVSYDKGCYIGQEVVSRVKSVGHVNWQLRGLRATGSISLQTGMVLRDPAESNGREIGHVTSVSPAFAPAADSANNATSQIALGYVRRGWETPGRHLSVFAIPAEASAPILIGEAEVSTLPFTS